MSSLFTSNIKWEKRGLIFKPDTSKWWMQSHAMIPTPLKISGNEYKIFFSGRNDQNQSHIGWFQIDLNDPFRIKAVSHEPVLTPGRLGCFDDNGVTPSCVIEHDGSFYLYYIGWNPGSTVRMHLFGGLAMASSHSSTFKRWSEAPIIERNRTDPFLNTAPWVVKLNNEWRMYYVSGTEWLHKDLPRYHIKMAFSQDGLNWRREGRVCIDFKNDQENALARPYVVFDDGIWKMWFAGKGKHYRLQYAESYDGIHWERNDNSNCFDVTENAFDSEMIEYAAIVKSEEKYYMFYNGNNYGFAGIGLAVGEKVSF